VRVHDGQLALALERARPGEALVEDAAERVDVGATVDRGTFDLLGRDVVDRAHEAAVSGQAAHGRHMPGEAEVAHVGVVRLADEDVAWLHIAVDEPSRMRRIESFGHLRDERERPLRLEGGLAAKQLTEVGARDVRHREVEHAVHLAGGEDRNDVRVIEARREV
jgi:hypothetical protein